MIAAGDCEAALAVLSSHLVAMLLLLLTSWLRKCVFAGWSSGWELGVDVGEMAKSCD